MMHIFHFSLIFFLKLINLFLAELGLCYCMRAFSSCGKRGLLFVVVRGLLIAVASLIAEHRLQVHRLQQLWLVGSRAQAQYLWCMSLVAPRHVGSSQTRARTRAPCTGRQILNHCTTREALSLILMEMLSFVFFSVISVSGSNLACVPVHTLKSRAQITHFGLQSITFQGCSGLGSNSSFAFSHSCVASGRFPTSLGPILLFCKRETLTPLSRTITKLPARGTLIPCQHPLPFMVASPGASTALENMALEGAASSLGPVEGGLLGKETFTKNNHDAGFNAVKQARFFWLHFSLMTSSSFSPLRFRSVPGKHIGS